MKAGSDLLDRLVELLEETGGPLALAEVAPGLLRTGEGGLAARVLESLVLSDERFRVEGGAVLLAPETDPFVGTPLEEVGFAVLDFETNGMGVGERAIEVGLALYRGREEEGSFQTLVNPGTPVAPFVTRLTGLRDADLAGQPAFGDIWAEMRGHLAGRVLVAHNLPFDRGVLMREVAILGERLPPHQAVCTLQLARRLFPRVDPKNLDALAERFSLTFTARHRALDDARVTGRLLYRLLDLAGDSTPMAAWQDLKAFLARRGATPRSPDGREM